MPPVSPLEGALATKSSDMTPARPQDALHGRARGEPAGTVADVARLGISGRDHVRIPIVGRDDRSDRGEPGAAPFALRAEKLRQWCRLVRPALGHEPHGTRRPDECPSQPAKAEQGRHHAGKLAAGELENSALMSYARLAPKKP